MLIAVNFHYVRPTFDTPFRGFYGITPDQLERQLNRLGRIGSFVSGEEVRAAVAGGGALPEKAILVTFDDGLREQYEHAWPILQRHGIPALFFINTRPIRDETISSVHKVHLLRANVAPEEFEALIVEKMEAFDLALPSLHSYIEKANLHYKYDALEAARVKYLLNMVLSASDRDSVVDALFGEVFGCKEKTLSRSLYMGKDQIRTLAAAGCLGSHGHEHLPLGQLTDREAEYQLRAASQIIESWTGHRPYALSYPYGSRQACTSSVAHIARAIGIEFALTMERAANHNFEHPLFLGRFDSNDVPGGKAARWEDEELFAHAPQATWN